MFLKKLFVEIRIIRFVELVALQLVPGCEISHRLVKY
jgi:hypothetical protein